MKVTPLAHTDKITSTNSKSLDNEIRKYIKKVNFPKKLVLNKVENEIKNIEKINKDLDDKFIKLEQQKELYTKTITKLQKENTLKISHLINELSMNQRF